VIELCKAQLQADGGGAPLVAYCWINMGRAARLEQTLRTDQDNAIIYADP
jgi:CBS domain-containing protein